VPSRDPVLVSRARRLRAQTTDVERLLWSKLRGRQLLGVKFIRQFPVGGYIADFACREHRLIVELDGSQHADNAYDAARTAELKALGYRVLRFWNRDVLDELDGVIRAIEAALTEAMLRWEERKLSGVGERAPDD
jgi:very-short-patch-repair endonuclease